MAATGIAQLFKMKEGQDGVDMINHLGNPVYMFTIQGT